MAKVPSGHAARDQLIGSACASATRQPIGLVAVALYYGVYRLVLIAYVFVLPLQDQAKP
jgi:hypothetical protein